MTDDLEQARFRIYALQDGAVRAQALNFALRSGIFERLNSGGIALDDLRFELGISKRVLPALVAFLTSQGLLARDSSGRVMNTETASTFLVRASDRYVGGRGLLYGGFWEAIRSLPQALATGMPWTAEGQHDMFEGFGAEEQRWFAEGMFANAVHGGRSLMEQVDFAPFERLLDVGGGAGGYTTALLLRHPKLRATIVDLEGVRALALEHAAESGVGDRLAFVACSFFEDALPGGHDVLLLSSILHDWGDDDARTILRNCFAAASPGATLVITEPMLAEDFSGPDHPAVSGLAMAVLGGENRTRGRIQAMLEEAGFEDCWQSPLLPQNSTVGARKPLAR
ncbi:MAG: methyltransferase [Tepidiformaceae bacterium]